MTLKLVALLPRFAAEVEQCLEQAGRAELAEQIREVELDRYTRDRDYHPANLYLRSPRELNIVEMHVIGVRHGETVDTRHPKGVYVDIDNFGRLRGIEVLSADGLLADLVRIMPPSCQAGSSVSSGELRPVPAMHRWRGSDAQSTSAENRQNRFGAHVFP